MKFQVIIAASLLMAACSGGANQEAEQGSKEVSRRKSDVSEKKRIVFFGNSLTAAYNLQEEQGFVALLQARLDSLGEDYLCVNAGVSGETTADGVSRIDWILNQQVDVFVLELGANDALRGLPLKESKKNLQQILNQLKEKHPEAKILIAGMEAPPNLGDEYTSQFRNMYRDLAQEFEAALLPFLLDGVGGVPELNLEDGIHPNAEGQKIVAENVWEVLEPLL